MDLDSRSLSKILASNFFSVLVDFGFGVMCTILVGIGDTLALVPMAIVNSFVCLHQF